MIDFTPALVLPTANDREAVGGKVKVSIAAHAVGLALCRCGVRRAVTSCASQNLESAEIWFCHV